MGKAKLTHGGVPKHKSQRKPDKAANKSHAQKYERRMTAQRRYTASMHPSAQSLNGPVISKVMGHDELPRFGTHRQRLYILERDGYKCRYCGAEVTIDTANLDHVKPFKHNGPTLVENLVACCRPCNKAKGNQTWKPKELT